MDDTVDLSGAWAGVYSYPQLMPLVPFEAMLGDRNGVIEGSTTERDILEETAGRVLNARIEGQRRHRHVSFWKTYTVRSADYGLVLYDGEVSADGLEISGRWVIPNAWSGTFLMIRASALHDPAEIATETEAPAGRT